MTLEEADLMIETCKQKGVLLMYAEELFFTPKYVKAREMARYVRQASPDSTIILGGHGAGENLKF